MRSQPLYTTIATISSLISPIAAQTYSPCNPLTGGSCPPNSALGKSVKVEFTSESDSFTPTGNPTYDSNGASLTVAKDGDSPGLSSKWYIMFGHVDFVVKAAPGTGIVSSCVLQSDVLDEIDFEWLGGDDQQVQSNYFGQGKTLDYNRGAFHPAPGNQDGFKTYSIDWTADQIVWSIEGKTVRSLSSSTASQYPYPQTPMMVKVGAWCGGCPSNEPGTIEWAGVAGSFPPGGATMQVKSISVTDYSTGSQYKYTGTDGSWRSIEAVGGSVNSKGGKSSGGSAPNVETSNTGAVPFSGTHKEGSSTVQQPNADGWSPTTLQTSSTPTTYPGLPAGWTVTDSGKVLPPSAAAVTPPPISPSSSQSDSSQDSQAGEEIACCDKNGEPIPLEKGAERKFDDKGFLVIPRAPIPADTQEAGPSETATPAQAAEESSSASADISKSTSTAESAAARYTHFSTIFFTLLSIATLFVL